MSEFVEGATTPEKNQGQTATTESTEEGTGSNDSALGKVVGEGQKFSDTEKLAEAYQHADQRIEELKLEVGKLNTEKAGVDDILAELRKQATTPVTASTETPGVTQEDIQKLVATQVQELQDSSVKSDKIKQTWGMLDESFGDRGAASAAVSAYIADDPAKKDLVNTMAVTDPAGLMKLIGKDPDKKTTTFTNNTGGTTNGELDLESKLTWEAAQLVRKKDPRLYYSHAFRKRMQEEL